MQCSLLICTSKRGSLFFSPSKNKFFLFIYFFNSELLVPESRNMWFLGIIPLEIIYFHPFLLLFLWNSMVLWFVYRLIQECWSDEPFKRPTFRQIIARLDDINNQLAQNRHWKVWTLCVYLSLFVWAWISSIFLKLVITHYCKEKKKKK